MTNTPEAQALIEGLPEKWHNHDGYRAIYTAALQGICANPNFFGFMFQAQADAAVEFALKVVGASIAATEPTVECICPGETEATDWTIPKLVELWNECGRQPIPSLSGSEAWIVRDHASQAKEFNARLAHFKSPKLRELSDEKIRALHCGIFPVETLDEEVIKSGRAVEAFIRGLDVS